MNRFKAAVQSERESREAIERAACEWSRRLQDATGMTDDIIKLAESFETEWQLPGHTMSAHYTCLCGGWRTLLRVVPDTCSVATGFSNVSTRPLPDTWQYRLAGTRTVIIPPADEQERILELVRDYRGDEE